MKLLSKLFGLSESRTFKVLKKQALIVSIAFAATTAAIPIQKASAQSIYFGTGIKHVRVCNNDTSFSINVDAEAYGDVKSVEFKSKYGRVYSPIWGAYQRTFGYAWRHLETIPYQKSGK